MAKALTVKTLENLRPAAARVEVPDGLIRGLFYVLQPSGKASWAVRYRHQRITRKLTLGTYPAIDLKAARELASRALVNVASGTDPAADKQAAKVAARDRDMVEDVVHRFIERYAKANASRSWPEVKRILDKEIVGAWKGRALADITRKDVHALLDGIVDRGSAIMANRTLAHLRRLCGWAVERDIIPSSPCQGVTPPSGERSRDRVLSDDELRRVWTAGDAIGWPFAPLFRLLILTGQRRDEVGGMRWSEIDLEAKTWTLPRERVKNGVEHVVPLSATALAIVKALPRIDGKTGYVFTTSGATAVSGFSRAKDRLDATIGAEGASLPPWTLHDLRRSFASGCAGIGIGLPVIEKILNHVSGSFGGIVGVYQRHTFADEKRTAMEAWGRHVESVVSGKAADNVVELKAVRS